MRRIALRTRKRRGLFSQQQQLLLQQQRATRLHHPCLGHPHPTLSQRFLSSSSSSSGEPAATEDVELVEKKVLTDKEQQENTRWAIGFFGVIMLANVFTIWQEWDALTGTKKKEDGLPGVSNGVETIDLYSDDTQKPRSAKYSY